MGVLGWGVRGRIGASRMFSLFPRLWFNGDCRRRESHSPLLVSCKAMSHSVP